MLVIFSAHERDGRINGQRKRVVLIIFSAQKRADVVYGQRKEQSSALSLPKRELTWFMGREMSRVQHYLCPKRADGADYVIISKRIERKGVTIEVIDTPGF